MRKIFILAGAIAYVDFSGIIRQDTQTNYSQFYLIFPVLK